MRRIVPSARQFRAIAGGMLAVALLLGLLPTIAAQEATPAATPEVQEITRAATPAVCTELLGIGVAGDACLTVIHASPDAPAVDIYVDEALALENLAFGETSGFVALPEGEYRVRVAPTGAGPEAAVIDVPSLAIEAGRAYEIAAIGEVANIQPLVNTVDLSPLPPGPEGTPLENTRVRVVHAVPDAPPVTISVIGDDIAERVFTDVAFGEVTDYATRLAGQYGILVSVPSLADISIQLDDVLFEANAVYTMYAIGEVATGELSALPVSINLETGEATGAAPGEQMADLAPYQASIAVGSCMDPTGQIAWDLEGEGHGAAGAGAIGPWGDGEAPAGAPDAVPLLYGEGVAAEATFDQLLNRGLYSLVVTDSITGETVACGDIGGVVEDGKFFWENAKLAFGLQPVGDNGLNGGAILIEDRGLLKDRVHLAIWLLAPADAVSGQ